MQKVCGRPNVFITSSKRNSSLSKKLNVAGRASSNVVSIFKTVSQVIYIKN